MTRTPDRGQVDGLRIGPAELRQKISDDTALLLHSGGPRRFRDGHIPGSITADPPACAAAGLGADQVVVVYGALAADPIARALALQLSASHPVRLFDDGLAAWARAGGAVEGRSTD